MKTSTYSFGEESPLKIQLTDKMARLYNEATKEFFNAQNRFNKKYGRPWDPDTDPIKIKWSKAQKKAWNTVNKMINKIIDNTGPYHENEIMDDFLVKNNIDAAIKLLPAWGSGIALACLGGALYELLRGQ